MKALEYPCDPAAPSRGQTPNIGSGGRCEFDCLVQALSHRTDILVTRYPDALVLTPAGPDGFAIRVMRHERGCDIDIGGCQQELDDLESARFWVLRALSRDYRLRVDLLADRPRRWTLEPCGGRTGDASLVSGSGMLLDLLGRLGLPRRVRYYAFSRGDEVAAVH